VVPEVSGVGADVLSTGATISASPTFVAATAAPQAQGAIGATATRATATIE
jgi:hypothetical protein